VVIRTVRWEDLDGLLEFINSLVEEGADIARDKKVTREEEAEWLRERLTSMEKGEVIHVVAVADGKLVGSARVAKRKGFSSHVGTLGIAVKSGYRGIGIGTKLLETIISESKKAGLKVLTLEVFETNYVAKALYKKMGFKEVGRIPKGIYRNGQYIDLAIMVLEM